MATTLPKFSFCCVLFLASILHQATAGSKHIPKFKLVTTQLSFYWQVQLSGSNPNAMPVIRPISPSKLGYFGGMTMFDSKLTQDPDPTSTVVGLAQGFYAGDSMSPKEQTALNVITLYLTTAKHNGSTIEILGRNSYMLLEREMPVIGGTGYFRFASGYAVARTHTFNTTTGDSIVGLNLTVMHA